MVSVEYVALWVTIAFLFVAITGIGLGQKIH